MKKIAAIIIALVLSPTISSAANAAVPVPAAEGRIYVVSGDVTVAQGKNPAHRVTDNEAIVSDTLINTGDKSAALLKFEDGQVVTIQANSAFHVYEYHYDAKRIENSNIVFSMFKGGMRFITGLIGQRRKQAFRLLTPAATIGIRGTEFMVAMVDNAMYSQVLTGNIGLTNAAGSVALGAGQTAVVASSGALATLVSASAIPAGTFTELLSIPVNPSAIPAPAAAAPPPASVPAASGAATGTAGAAAGAGAAASVAGASIGAGAAIGVAGGALAGLAGSGSDSKPSAAQTAAPAVGLDESTGKEEMDKNRKSGIGLTGKIGTLGYGAELNFGKSDRISARVGLNAYTYKRNANSSEVNYDFKLQLQTVSVLADWYPFEGRFRASGGLLYNNNKFSLTAKPTGGNYTINGVPYSSATQVGSLQGTMTFNKTAPYLGIGWGNPVAKDKGWGLVSDFGVMFQGKPKTNLAVTCGAALTVPQCDTLQTDTAAENTKLQNDLSNFKLWPVVSFGISYQW